MVQARVRKKTRILKEKFKNKYKLEIKVDKTIESPIVNQLRDQIVYREA